LATISKSSGLTHSGISQSAVTLHRVAASCFVPAQPNLWRCAGAGGAGQLQRVARGHIRLQSASELVKQETYCAMQTFFLTFSHRSEHRSAAPSVNDPLQLSDRDL
jgi:hypothetical protein